MSDQIDMSISDYIEELWANTPSPASTDSQSVLELLAMTMFADKQVLAVEIQAFVKIVLRFQRDHVISTELTEADIIHWYEARKKDLASVVQEHQFESWINQKIEALQDFPDKHLLLRAMDEIAVSDGDKHVSEEALEVLTTQKWAEALIQKYSRKNAVKPSNSIPVS